MTTTAAQVIARSACPVTTETSGEVPSGYFAIRVNLAGTDYQYLAVGDAWHMRGESIAIGRIRRIAPNAFDATTPEGERVAHGVDRESAFRALTHIHR